MNEHADEKIVRNVPARKRRGCLGCLGRGAIGLLVFLVIVMAAGAIYQAAASASDLKKYPPPGKRYDVGGHRLQLYCTGEGSPGVILEAGAGSPGLIWTFVQEKLSSSTRVCSYDRAGFGWSDPASGPLSPANVAQELHTLLGEAGIPGPYILVGHSAGGVYVRAYTSQYPSEVAGLVLLDSSHEGQNVRFPPEYLKMANTQNTMTTFCRLVSPFGGMRITRVWDMLTAGYAMDPQVGAALLSTMYRTSYCRASAEEVKALSVFISQPDIPDSLGDLPLIVLTADTSEEEMQAQIPAYLKSIVGPEVIKRIYETGRELQQELAGLSSQGKQIMVKQSGHNIMLDQPGAVIDAIREVIGKVRGE
jgi:pimeloyl-ACP methyl ester carboxylesterase